MSKKSEIFRQAKEEVLAGKDRHAVFAAYQGQITRPIQLAMVLSSIARPENKAKAHMANTLLIFLLVIVAVLKTVGLLETFSYLGLLPAIMIAMVGIVIPMLCAVEAYRWNGQIYMILPLFCFAAFVQLLREWLESRAQLGMMGLVILGTVFGLFALVLFLSIYIKKTVFPGIAGLGPKKDAQGQFVLG